MYGSVLWKILVHKNPGHFYLSTSVWKCGEDSTVPAPWLTAQEEKKRCRDERWVQRCDRMNGWTFILWSTHLWLISYETRTWTHPSIIGRDWRFKSYIQDLSHKSLTARRLVVGTIGLERRLLMNGRYVKLHRPFTIFSTFSLTLSSKVNGRLNGH